MKVYGNTPLEAAENILRMKRYQPFKYSGKWFVTAFEGQGYAYRALATLQKALAKAGCKSAEVYTVDSK